jgi:hypothetical protein
MQGSNSTQTAASKDPSNPLKPSDSSGSSSSTSTGDSATASATADSDKAANGSGYKTAALDPALRKLVEDELKYEPADKRQILLDQWSKFDPAFIRELVENHRMARELAESRHGGSVFDTAASGTSGAPVKTASNDQAPALEDPNAPKDSILRERSARASSAQASAAPLGAASPWDDTPAAPPLSPQGRPAAASPAGVAQSNASGTPVAPSPVASAGPPAPPKSDAWDADSAPRPQTPITANTKPGPDAVATTMPPAPGTALPAAPTGKADAFAGLTPIDTEPPAAATPAPTSNAATPKVVSSQAATTAQRPPSDPFADNPSTPPSVAGTAAAPGNSPPSKTPAAPVAQAGGTGPFDGPGVSLTSGTNSPPNQPGAESEQPVKLAAPIDVPDGQVVSAADSGAGGTRTAQASATSPTQNPQQPPTNATSNPPQPSGLAALPGRLLGAINPLPGANGTRNISLPANWHEELAKVVTAAATEAGQTSVGTSDTEKLAYIQKQVNLRMLYLLSGQPTRSLEPIAGLEPADQEFWQQVFWGMSSYFDKNTIADPRDRATQTITQLRAAVHKLQEKSKLELRNVAFCNKIENYGRFERFKRDEFTAGQPVLLYAEVENFKSEQVTDGYRVILKSTIEVFDAGGKRVVSMPFAPNEDLCSSPRRDYYNSYEFSVPQQISLGPHTLKLTVEDQLSQKVATYSVNFTVK